MANHNGSRFHTAKLEDIVALNDEISALVRAGVPLELGLHELSRDLRGSLGRLAARLGSRMSSGDSLPEALDAEQNEIPRMYRAVVEAGLKSGRLPAALEAVSRHAQSLQDLYRRVTLACIYPLVIFVVGYALFLMMLTEVIPRFEEMLRESGMPVGIALSVLRPIAETMPFWGPVIPLLVFAIVGYWVLFQKRSMLRTGRPLWLFRLIPWTGGISRALQMANFSELLGLLTAQQVPLHTGILLAAESTGHRAMIRSAEEISLLIQSGETLGTSIRRTSSFPAYLCWMIHAGEQQRDLPKAMQRAAAVYRARAEVKLETMKLLLPLITVTLFGGGITLLYGLTLFTPLSHSLRGLGAP